MKSLRSLSFGLALLLSVMGSTLAVHAQDPVQGRFTLPYSVHWEKTMVPAGKYIFSVKAVGASRLLMLQPADRNSDGMFILLHAEDEMEKGNSEVVMVSHEGEWVVSSLRLANLGMALRFAVPDSAHAAKQIARAIPGTPGAPAR